MAGEGAECTSGGSRRGEADREAGQAQGRQPKGGTGQVDKEARQAWGDTKGQEWPGRQRGRPGSGQTTRELNWPDRLKGTTGS